MVTIASLPYIATLIGLCLFILGYYIGRISGVDIGAAGMFEELRDTGFTRTVITRDADGNEVEELVPPK